MDDRCPKCFTPKTGESCRKCGLVFAKFDAAVLEEGVPEELKLIWQNVENNWGDSAAHALFIERALAAQALGYAAVCYRRRHDDPVARQQIERINERLEQLLVGISSENRPARAANRTFRAVFLVIFTAVVVALIVYLGQKIIR